jgi:hypothetical protein
MAGHFGVNIHKKSDGLNLTRDNYIKVKNKSTLRKDKIFWSGMKGLSYISICLYDGMEL